MKNLKFLLLMLFLVVTAHSFAIPIQEATGIDLGDPQPLIVWLAPVITWAVTAVSRLVIKLPGWVTVSVIVPALGFLIGWIATQQSQDASWLITFLLSLGATFVEELRKKISNAI